MSSFPLQYLQKISHLAAIFVLAVTAISATSQSASAEAPAKYMQRVAKQLQKAARSGSEAQFLRVLRSHSDYPDLGLYSLGSYRNRLASKDRPPYYKGMLRFIARYASTNAPKFPVASAVVTGQSSAESKRGAYVDSVITLKDGTQYEVRWLVRRRGKGWKVRDAQVVGFWMSPFLKDLFEKYIAENGGNPRALVFALNQ